MSVLAGAANVEPVAFAPRTGFLHGDVVRDAYAASADGRRDTSRSDTVRPSNW
ncbi:hypothetical protein BgramDRAFT_3213 [Paraburkholderia graminis C4D1M]|jgi:hypothetical protein|uniref:Uncharacterized protein n=1 Tax=Paraburkholderia graminis (strain ATCC 700544 / DSM 17151 / LMG 18924 / NCIMB 13744 / C4D1M) TaxID=396598 RepID=B1G1L8_PARG4|nr:hypothetical protein BgramDRAFT_3213 [Paraburkholderia graminis C4D1M]